VSKPKREDKAMPPRARRGRKPKNKAFVDFTIADAILEYEAKRAECAKADKAEQAKARLAKPCFPGYPPLRDKPSARGPAERRAFAFRAEISGSEGMRGGPGSSRTNKQKQRFIQRCGLPGRFAA